MLWLCGWLDGCGTSSNRCYGVNGGMSSNGLRVYYILYALVVFDGGFKHLSNWFGW